MSFLDFNTSKLTSFEPSEFYSESFSVDEFIQRKRYNAPLDVLRDDLGSHLKTLRSNLIELINQDYGQFVNLSSHLVGLDGKIQNIIGPLSRSESDIRNLYVSLENTMVPLQIELEERRSIRASQNQLQFLRRAIAGLDSSEKYLANCREDIRTSSDFNSLKIASDKVSDTRQLIQRCLPSPLVKKLQARLDSCSSIVLKKLEFLLRSYGNSAIPEAIMNEKNNISPDNSEDDQTVRVRLILFIFSQLQWEAQAENIFVAEILKPKCDTVLARKGNVSALLSEIESFIHHSSVIHLSRQLEQFPWMKNYDFLSRAIFPHIVNILVKQFPHIWSPSTPDSFHSNWIRFSAFVEEVEGALPSLNHLETFRNSAVLKEFVGKWQFNVYFQLRFHSLSVEFESVLDSILANCLTSDFKLDATRVLIKVINQCWDTENVFIPQLSSRFLKASALFVSRYLKEIQLQVTSNPKVTLDQLIAVSADLTLSEIIVGQILTEKIKDVEATKRDPFEDGDDSRNSNRIESQGALFLSMFSWKETREGLEARLVELTVTESIPFVSSVNEVPRLFRRTNREVPTKPSEYVHAILKPIQALHQSMKEAKQGDLLERVGPKVGKEILERYKVQMDEVLTSVQRMEESLKRLKKVKGQNQIDQSNRNNESDFKMNNTNLSDDNKIRLQIQLDYEYLSEQVTTRNYF